MRKIWILMVGTLLISLSVFPQKNMRFRSNLSYPKRLSDIWGYADSSGNEYALVGVLNGVSIVDITNPDSIYEVQFIPGPESIWRDLKTWKHYAYVTNETSGGLLIIDLKDLPDSVQTSWWTADTALSTAHNLYIDEKGFAYIFGFNNSAKELDGSERGALIADLNPDPEHPVFAGHYKAQYVHDGFVRGDTLWAAEIYIGNFGVVDVSDKSNPIVLAVHETPTRTTHNCWLSVDGKTLFTTDESGGGFIGSYDVSDLNNIKENDRYQAAPNTGLIPHNTHVINNFLVTSYYKYGVNIVDATKPDNLVEVGYYDTSPFLSEDGYGGCWGAYPFLPSGNVLATDIEIGLFVLTPDYVRACYLEGNITYQNNGNAVIDAQIEIMTTGTFSNTNLTGNYKTGTVDPGLYDIRITKLGCLPKIIAGVSLQQGVTSTLNTAINCTTLTGISSLSSEKVLQFFAVPTVFSNAANLFYEAGAFGEQEALHLRIFDTNGKILNSITLSEPEGEIEWGNGYSAGIYIAEIQNTYTRKTIRLIKTN